MSALEFSPACMFDKAQELASAGKFSLISWVCSDLSSLFVLSELISVSQALGRVRN